MKNHENIKIQFSHANGFPARTYDHLFSLLRADQVHYIPRMGHSHEAKPRSLHWLASELIKDIESRGSGPVIGIGHSTGAMVTIFAAMERPELFRDIIAIDPPIFRHSKRLFYRAFQSLGIDRYTGPAPLARKRRSRFPSRDEAYRNYASRRLFKDFDEQCLADYIQYGLEERDEQFCLAFSKQVEYEIFRIKQFVRLPNEFFKVRGTMIYGDKSHLISEKDVQWWKQRTQFNVLPFPGGHLFPFEQPGETASLIREIITGDK